MVSSLTLNGRSIHWGERTLVMGILNVTPDSFSGDGILPAAETYVSAEWLSDGLEQARRFAAAGVDFLDIGGESTRPGAAIVSAEVEIERILPVIRAIRSELDVIISVDTYKASVAEAALDAGSHCCRPHAHAGAFAICCCFCRSTCRMMRQSYSVTA